MLSLCKNKGVELPRILKSRINKMNFKSKRNLIPINYLNFVIFFNLVIFFKE